MSSISSFEVCIENDFDFIKRLDELESGDSGSDDIHSAPIVFKYKIEENELDLIRLYLKCKKNV
jgi:hypothetical protein